MGSLSWIFFFPILQSCANTPNFPHFVKITSTSSYVWHLKAWVFQKAARPRRSCDDSQALHGSSFLLWPLLRSESSWVGSWVPSPRMTHQTWAQLSLLPCFLPGHDQSGSVVPEPARCCCWPSAWIQGQHLNSGQLCAAQPPSTGTSSVLGFWPTYFQGLLSWSVCYLLSQGMVEAWERFSCLQ